jgi:conjugative transposon TraN protein
MKKILLSLLCLFVITQTQAQVKNQTLQHGLLKTMSPDAVGKTSYNFEVSYNKTSHIIFPSKIIYVDAGSMDIITSAAENLENVLRVKANVVDFPVETNLTVATDDGNFWSFIIKYNEFPEMLNIDVRTLKYGKTTSIATIDTKKSKKTEFSSTDKIRDDRIGDDRIFIEEQKKDVDSVLILTNEYNTSYASEKFTYLKSLKDETLLGDQTGKVKFKLLGLYSIDDFVLVKVKVINNSKLNYRLEQVRFFNVDSEKKKNVSYQEIELMPIYSKLGEEWINGGISIESKESIEGYFMLPLFSIADNKELTILFNENLGGRAGEVRIDYQNFYNTMKHL